MSNSQLQSLYSKRFVISGRNALAYYNLCSLDPKVEYIEFGVLSKKKLNLDHIIYVDDSEPTEVVAGKDGVRYAPLNKALADYLTEPYDDSAVEDIFNLISDKQLESFKQFLKRKNLRNVRAKYAEFI
jgi:hypothetical protein